MGAPGVCQTAHATQPTEEPVPKYKRSITLRPVRTYGRDDRCRRCRSHVSEPHNPRCKNADPIDRVMWRNNKQR